MQRRALLTGLSGLLTACASPLGAFNALAPRDGAGQRIAEGLAYGEGPRRRLDIYAPAAPGPRPVIIFFYGGSWNSGRRQDYAFAGAAFAARGFVTVIPDYRLVPETRFPGFIEDCAAALRWVSEHAGEYGGDPSRIVLVGHSAGAYNAVMLALNARYMAEGGVDPERVRGAVGLAGPYDFLPLDAPATIGAFGGAPDAQLTQPVHFARAGAPPLLLLWGEADTTVGSRNHRSLAAAVSSAGGQVETKTYPGVNHVDIMLAVSRPFRGRAPTLDDVVAFAGRVAAR